MLSRSLELTQNRIESFETFIRENEISMTVLEFQMREDKQTLSLSSLSHSALQRPRIFSEDSRDFSKTKVIHNIMRLLLSVRGSSGIELLVK